MADPIEYRRGVHPVPVEPTGSRKPKGGILTAAGKKRREEIMDAFHNKALRIEGVVVTDWKKAHAFAKKSGESVSANPITMTSQF
jgi:hypothetical protein